MESNNSNNNVSGRTPDDYARQQEDIRATQTFGESSLDRDVDQGQGLDRSSEERERGQGVEPGTGKPIASSNPGEDLVSTKKEPGYTISPTATPVKL